MEEIDIGLKTEIEDKVKGISKLIKDDDLDMDGMPEEILKREPLAELAKICEEELEMSKHCEDKEQMHAFFETECHNKLQALLDSVNRQKKQVEEKLRTKERELNTSKQKASDYENQIIANRNEISELAQKNLEQEDELGKLNSELTARTKDCSALQRKLNKAEKDASGKITAFKAEVDNLQKTKQELELSCEKLREEHAQTLTIVGNENNELASKIMDLQRTLKEQEDAYQKLNEEYKQVDSKFNECKVNLEAANRKIEETEEELRESFASKDQIVTDLEHQVEVVKRDLQDKGNETSTLLENVNDREEKLRDTEQLLSEKEESFRKAEEELQQVQRELEDRNASKVCVDSVKNGKDTVRKKFSDDCNNYKIENCIANISGELQDVKEYVSEMNREKEKLQNDNKLLLEKVEKLEANARKEESEKMNENSKLAHEKLEIKCKNMEAIRQLSLKIDNLTEIVSKSHSNC